jgi:hypothetical protein
MAANSLAEAMEAGLRTLGLWNDAMVPTPGSKRVPCLNPRVLGLLELDIIHESFAVTVRQASRHEK